jgi:hypothetical protein
VFTSRIRQSGSFTSLPTDTDSCFSNSIGRFPRLFSLRQTSERAPSTHEQGGAPCPTVKQSLFLVTRIDAVLFLDIHTFSFPLTVSMSSTRQSFSTTHWSFPTTRTRHSLSSIYSQLPTARLQLPATCFQLPAARSQLKTGHSQLLVPAAHSQLPATRSQLPDALLSITPALCKSLAYSPHAVCLSHNVIPLQQCHRCPTFSTTPLNIPASPLGKRLPSCCSALPTPQDRVYPLYPVFAETRAIRTLR